MEIFQYFRIIRRWAWLILLGAFVGGSANYVIQSRIPPRYTATTTLIIGNSIENPNPSPGEVSMAQLLTGTYQQLLETDTINEAIAQALDANLSASQVRGSIRVSLFESTAFMTIRATHADAVLAADMANEAAAQLIQYSPTNLSEDQQAQLAVAQTQVDELSREIRDLRSQLEGLNDALASIDDVEESFPILARRSALIDQINQTSANIAQFTSIITALQRRTNSLTVIDTASIPTRASGVDLTGSAILGASIGAALMLGLVFGLEYLNDRIRTTDELVRVLKLPILGVITKLDLGNRFRVRRRRQAIITQLPPLSRKVEEYHMLRANFSLAKNNVGDEHKTFVITSAVAEEGKSTTTVNLAISLAQSGKQVMLIDADLRRPKVHDMLNLSNDQGLFNLFMEFDVNDDLADRSRIEHLIQDTEINGLRVIPSGPISTSPNELLSSPLVQNLVNMLVAQPDVDIILFDTPPCLVVSDSIILTGNTQAKVILVIQANRTRRSVATRAKERFIQLPNSVIGVVLNKADPRSDDYYGYDYTYYSNYRTNLLRRGPSVTSN